MMRKVIKSGLLYILTAGVVIAAAGLFQDVRAETVTANVTVDVTKKSEPINPYIYGQFIEHLGRCIYGGIWAEMLEDRKFLYPVPADGDIWGTTREQARVLRASPWKVVGPAGCVQMTTENPYSAKHEPVITVAGAPAGIYQEELALVKGKKYVGRIVLSGDSAAAPIRVSLLWGQGRNDKETFTIARIMETPTTVKFEFTASADSDNGKLEITAAGKGNFRIGAVSLMPADNVNGFRKDTLEILKQLNSPIYRWPGGNFVSGYEWRDGIGDPDKRPTRRNPAWTGIETNDVGLHEFIEFCKLVNAEPMVIVNTGFGDAYSAALQVQYCNGAADTPMGKWRAENGQTQPWNLKWWGIGNEMFGRWQLGYMQLNQYVIKHNMFVERMRQIDPSIKVVGVGNVGSWTKGMLENCADTMYLVSEHFYCNNDIDNIVEHARQIPREIKRICDAHREYRRTMDVLRGKDIRISMDEWNYWYGPHPYGELGTRYFHKDGLGIAAGLHEYFRNSDIVTMANYAQTVNVIGCVKTTKTAAAFDATGLVLKMYREAYGSVPVEVAGAFEPLDVVAALSGDGSFITIGVVNATPDKYKLNMNFASTAVNSSGKCWTIANPDPKAYNSPEGEQMLKIEQAEVENSKQLEVAPMSASVFRLAVR